MAWFTRSSRFTLLAVALTLGLAVNVPAQVQAQTSPSSPSNNLVNRGTNSFRPPRGPGPSAPVNTIAGGTRGACKEREESPSPSSPASGIGKEESPYALIPASGIGKTVAEYPTLFWYMPKTSASRVEFVLRDANDKEVYKTTYRLAKSADGVVGAPGVMGLTIPSLANLSPLEIGQEYKWELTLICNYPYRDSDIVVEGKIKRVALDPILARRVQLATPQQRVALYKKAGLWHEALSTMIELQRDRPNDPNLAATWDNLLESQGM